jgi:hypothetical protein
MESNLQEILHNKALEVEATLTTADYSCQYTLIQNGINFMVFLVGREAKFTLYYKPTKGLWSFYSVDEWAKSEVQPRLTPLLVRPSIGISKPLSALEVEHNRSSPGPALYFEAALECFHLLQPFAAEYIDFSIIYEQTKIGVKGILADERYTHFNRQALKSALVIPSACDFISAKEYLSQCLTLCKIQIHL